MGYGLEIDLIRVAKEKDLLTTPYVFSAEGAVEMVKAGADLLVPHMGLTTGGSVGAETSKTLDDCVKLIDEWADAARRVRKDIIILCHGGPIADPKDAEYVLKNTNHCHGFYGASSMERLPTEVALTRQVQQFKSIRSRSSGA
jgi:predicted TIM-barrel enzyme